MEVLTQAPQPIIQCYRSFTNFGEAQKIIYQEFTPTTNNQSGKNLQSYNFENNIDNFGGSFSFTVKEDVKGDITGEYFMDKVQPLDIIVISESGNEKAIDFIGVVTTVSIGGVSSNLTKIVTVSGKSIEWLFLYYNINTDLKSCVFQNKTANSVLKIDLAQRKGSEGVSIADIVKACYLMFAKWTGANFTTVVDGKETKVSTADTKKISNYAIGDLIKIWYGDDFIESTDEKFMYPISSNLFDSGKITFIDYIKKILPAPIYEVYGYINEEGKPKLKVRKVPFSAPIAKKSIKPGLLTDFTLTRTCEEVYTAFMPYVEGSSRSPSFYMNLQAATGGDLKGYNSAKFNEDKVRTYGLQLLTCSFVGYRENVKNNAETLDNAKLQALAEDMEKWFGHLDDMYSGDFTLVNYIKDIGKSEDKCAKIGEWVSFSQGLFYVVSAKHSWTYGDNPMINLNVIRGGKYSDKGEFVRLRNLSAMYSEFGDNK